MANNCIYEMLLAGPVEALERFEKMVRYEDRGNCFYRVFSAECEFVGGGRMSVYGDCAWSFECCFLKSTEVESGTNGVEERKRWNLDA